MQNCIFCKIAAREIPTENILFEDEFVVAFPDIHPVAPGHTLVIPKQHYQWFYEVPDELSSKWFNTAKHLAEHLKADQGADYVQLSIVGKDVPHAHIHLIPRKIKEGHTGL